MSKDQNKEITFEALFDKWLEDKSKNVNEHTITIYRSYFDKYLPEHLKSCAVNRIYPDEWSDIKSDMLDGTAPNGSKVPNTTARQALSVYRSAFAYGENMFGLNNPAKDEQISSKTMYSVTVFTEAEVKKMIKAIKPFDIYHLGIMICLYTGIEINEICALKWGNIDTENGLLMIHKVIGCINKSKGFVKDNVVLVEPKNRRVIRDLPIPTWIVKQLGIMKPIHDDEEFFLAGQDGNAYPTTFRTKYSVFLKNAGIEKRIINALRHTFAMTCIKKNVDVKTLSEMLGHSNSTVTIRMYYGVRKKDKREIIENLYG